MSEPRLLGSLLRLPHEVDVRGVCVRDERRAVEWRVSIMLKST